MFDYWSLITNRVIAYVHDLSLFHGQVLGACSQLGGPFLVSRLPKYLVNVQAGEGRLRTDGSEEDEISSQKGFLLFPFLDPLCFWQC
jgi:hypothetical protein